MNNPSQVAGSRNWDTSDKPVGFLWDPVSGLRALGAWLQPVAINSTGQVGGLDKE